MKSKLPVLEYVVAGTNPGKRAKWGFRFRTPEGGMLIQSGIPFSSQTEAQRGFISLMKSVATNQYKVEYSVQAGSPSNPSHRPNACAK